MATRIIRNSRVVWQTPDFPRPAKDLECRDRFGNPVDCVSAIVPKALDLKLRAGDIARDTKTNVVYRVLEHLDPKDGWGSAEFWVDRWNLDFRAIEDFARAGYLDAGIERASQVRRYCCRNELNLRASKPWKDAKNRISRARNRAKSAERKQKLALEREQRATRKAASG